MFLRKEELKTRKEGMMKRSSNRWALRARRRRAAGAGRTAPHLRVAQQPRGSPRSEGWGVTGSTGPYGPHTQSLWSGNGHAVRRGDLGTLHTSVSVAFLTASASGQMYAAPYPAPIRLPAASWGRSRPSPHFHSPGGVPAPTGAQDGAAPSLAALP